MNNAYLPIRDELQKLHPSIMEAAQRIASARDKPTLGKTALRTVARDLDTLADELREVAELIRSYL